MGFRLSNRYVVRKDDYYNVKHSLYSIDDGNKIEINNSMFILLSLLENNNFTINEINNYFFKLNIPPITLKDFDFLIENQIILESEEIYKTNFLDNLYLSTIESDKIKILAKYQIPITSTPMNVEIHFTQKCNLRCSYCAYSVSENNFLELTSDIWIKTLKEFEDLRINSIVISGGEPFLYKDFNEILLMIAKLKIRFFIFTNGLLINDNNIRLLRSKNVTISISLDGYLKGTHELFRGFNTFDKVINSIELLGKNDVNFYISTTLNKKNIFEIEKIINIGIQNKAKSIQFGKIEQFGFGRKLSEFILDSKDIMLSKEIINNLKIKYKEQINIDFNEDKFFDIEENDNNNLIYCSAGTHRMTISPDGKVYPCVICFNDKKFEIGSILNDNLLDIWLNKDWNYVRNSVFLEDLTFCKSCNNNKICLIKSCRLGAFYSESDFFGKPPFCNVNIGS